MYSVFLVLMFLWHFQCLLLIHFCIVLVPALLRIWVPVLRFEFVCVLVVCLCVSCTFVC